MWWMSTYKEAVNTVVGRFTSLIFSKVSELKKETVCPWATVRMSWSLESSMPPTGLVKWIFLISWPLAMSQNLEKKKVSKKSLKSCIKKEKTHYCVLPSISWYFVERVPSTSNSIHTTTPWERARKIINCRILIPFSTMAGQGSSCTLHSSECPEICGQSCKSWDETHTQLHLLTLIVPPVHIVQNL